MRRRADQLSLNCELALSMWPPASGERRLRSFGSAASSAGAGETLGVGEALGAGVPLTGTTGADGNGVAPGAGAPPCVAAWGAVYTERCSRT